MDGDGREEPWSRGRRQPSTGFGAFGNDEPQRTPVLVHGRARLRRGRIRVDGDDVRWPEVSSQRRARRLLAIREVLPDVPQNGDWPFESRGAKSMLPPGGIE